MTATHHEPEDFERLLEAAHRGPMPDSAACPDAAVVASYVDNALSDAERAAFERHAADCARCAQALALLADIDEPARADAGVPAAARWFRWRWLVPVATVLVVFVVWRELPQRDLDNVVSDSIASDTSAPAKPSPSTAEPSSTAQSSSATTQPPAPERGSGAGQSSSVGRTPSAPAVPDAPAQPAPSLRQKAAPQRLLRKDLEREAQAYGFSQTVPKDERSSASKAVPMADRPTAPRFESPQEDKELSSRDTAAPSATAAPLPAPRASAEADSLPRLAGAAAANVTLQVKSADGGALYRRPSTTSVERSVDDGRTWVAESTPDVPGLHVGSSPAAGVCWLAGARGRVLRRTGDGVWHVASLPEPLNITGILAKSETSASVTTEDGARWTTSDGGEHWRRT